MDNSQADQKTRLIFGSKPTVYGTFIAPSALYKWYFMPRGVDFPKPASGIYTHELLSMPQSL